MPQRGAHEQHPQHGGEGKAPHRAEAFVAIKRREDTSQSATTRHAKGMTTGPLQIQPDIRREGPAGLTGPESTRRQPRGEGRGGETGKSRPNRKHPSRQIRQERRQQPHQNQRTAAKREEPCSTKEENHTRSTQATANHNRDIQGRQEMHGRKVQTQTHHTKQCKKGLGRMSIPAQSADRHTHAQCSNLRLRL